MRYLENFLECSSELLVFRSALHALMIRLMPIPSKQETLAFVEMKARRAQEHFDALQIELDRWLRLPPYVVTRETDLNRAEEIWRLRMKMTPERIAMLLGDFISNLRSALDQLAWGLAHLDTTRIFSERDERNISFLIFKVDNSTYRNRLALFPSAVASALDSFQPYHRGNAYRDHPLWQLNELWSLDKHKAIPINSSSLSVNFPLHGWDHLMESFTYGFDVRIPLLTAWVSPVEIEPTISMQVLFGEYLGDFIVSRSDLSNINDFVRNEVIPRFTSFFT